MLSKLWGKLLLFAGIGAFINSIIFIFFANEVVEHFVIFFYFVHSSITILAGYLFLKRKKLGEIFLNFSMLMFLLAIPIQISSHGFGGAEVYNSLFVFTVLVSFVIAVTGTFLPVLLFTAIFIIFVFISYISFLIDYFKRREIDAENNKLESKKIKKDLTPRTKI